MITDWERAEIDRANASGLTPVMFIHGLWLLPSSWQRWAEVFESNGYAAIAVGWPDDPPTVEQAQAHGVEGRGIRQRHQEFRIRELFDRDDADLGHRAKERRERRRDVQRETVVQEVQRAKLVLRDAVRAAEVVDDHATRRRGIDRPARPLDDGRCRRRQQRVDFVLRENLAHACASARPSDRRNSVRSRAIASERSWLTRDSHTPMTSPISASVNSSW